MQTFAPRRALRVAAVGAAALAAGAAQAHTGHEGHTLYAGLSHPFGLDHLLAMVAVGAWSAAMFDGARRWIAPMLFLAALAAGAAAGMAGFGGFGVEHGIALSVSLFGLLLIAGRVLPVSAGLVLVAAAGVLHGVAHGAEAPAAGAAMYAAGFLATTALLHGAGVGLGALMQRGSQWLRLASGSALAATGLLLLTRV